ncbi:TnsA-like heteromeric transposase endonuclease subunit [Streptomyces sp. NPDC002851]
MTQWDSGSWGSALSLAAGVRQRGDAEAVFVDELGQLSQLPWAAAVAEVRLEDAPPVSAFPVVPGKRWGPGWWWSATTGRRVAHGSAAMLTQLMILDRDPQVTGLAGRPVRVVWRDARSRVRSWIPQVFARYADGTGLLADCPAGMDAGGVRAQRAGAVLEALCAQVGWRYRRLGPPDAVVAANVRWLAGYRHPRYRGQDGLEEAVLEAFAQPRPLIEGAVAVGDPLAVLPVVYHALWAGRLEVALDSPLHEQVMVAPGCAGKEAAW